MSSLGAFLERIYVGEAPCDGCRHGEHCASTGEVCRAFASFVAGRGAAHWRRQPHEPDRDVTARAAAAHAREVAEELAQERLRRDRERARERARAAYLRLRADPAKRARRLENYRRWVQANPDRMAEYARRRAAGRAQAPSAFQYRTDPGSSANATR